MPDPEIVGINLETLHCHQVTNRCSASNATTATSIPPAMVLPSGKHQLQLDQWFPAYPAGTGEEWPEEAMVGNGFSRRMPIGLLWQLAKDDRIWKVDAETSIDPIQALGVAARQLMGQRVGSVGLVIPNWLRQSQQQVLLDAASRSGAKWYLVWRPIAAATEWLSRFPLNPPQTTTRKPIGKVVVLHLGLFECEFTVVEIVADPVGEKPILLPARLRADKITDFHPGTMSNEFLNNAASSLGVDIESSAVWRQMWATPWLIREFNALCGQIERPSGRFPDEYDPPALPLQLKNSNSTTDRSSGIEWRIESILATREWIDQKLRKAGPVEGAVVTGELAAVSHGGKSLGVLLLEQSVAAAKILISGSAAETDALAAGAAKQCSRLVNSQPSYLTKLPLLRTVVSRMGQPEWISLLADDDAYVPGGQKWSRPQPVGGIRLPGSKVLKLAVDHEDFDGVREASIIIPASFLPNQAAELHVEITPAQGNAKIEVITVPKTKTQSPLIANLQKMEEVLDKNQKSLTPKNYLELYLRVAPPVQPRLPSPTHWANIAEDLVIPLLRRAATWWSAEDLRRIKDVLREKRNLGSLQNITAIGSDGQVRKYCTELDRLIEGAFLKTKSRDPDICENAKRLLAYTSTASPLVQDYLVKHSKIVPARNEDFRMIGNCLRDENAIRSFLNTCHSHQLSGDHDYVRTIAELASYRESALSQIETKTLNKIYESIASSFREHAKCSNLGLPFRYLTLCVAFLLRRRIFDDSFVPPDGKIASLVKETCLNVIERRKKGTIHIMGGSVDLPAVMMQLIKYVDREGQGAFVLAT